MSSATINDAPPRTSRAERMHVRQHSTFKELTAKIQAAGLLERRYGFYWSMMGGAALALGGIVAGAVLLGESWYLLLLAAALGVVLSQLGFLGHEAAHRQIFRSAHRNEWAARVLSTLLVGLSYSWWMNKHNRHHANPNKLGADPDIEIKVVSFTGEAASERKGLWARLGRIQGYYFLPLLLLEGLSLHAASIGHVLRDKGGKRRAVEITFLAVRILGYVGLLFWLLPPGLAAAFLGVQLAVFGFLLGGAFTPNHTAMPIVPREAQLDFLRRQVLMSRNISGGPVVRFLMGGLHYQVEHHLFPMMARPSLRKAAVIVREHCRTHDIAYTETSLWRSYGVILSYLNRVGLRHRNTFACPVAQLYRI